MHANVFKMRNVIAMFLMKGNNKNEFNGKFKVTTGDNYKLSLFANTGLSKIRSPIEL